MKAKDLRTKTIEELHKERSGILKDLEKFANDVYKGKEKNVSKGRILRKNLAVVLTLINEKKIMENTANV